MHGIANTIWHTSPKRLKRFNLVLPDFAADFLRFTGKYF